MEDKTEQLYGLYVDPKKYYNEKSIRKDSINLKEKRGRSIFLGKNKDVALLCTGILEFERVNGVKDSVKRYVVGYKHSDEPDTLYEVFLDMNMGLLDEGRNTDFILRRLLNEERVKICKKNAGGFLGIPNLKERKIDCPEEMLTAVMMYQKIREEKEKTKSLPPKKDSNTEQDLDIDGR